MSHEDAVRWTHILRRNHNVETPTRALFVEIDKERLAPTSGTWRYRLQTGVAIHAVRNAGESDWRETDYYFHSVASFWDIIDMVVCNKTKTVVCISDALHTLALLNVFTEGFRRGFRWSQIVIQCPPTIVKGRRCGATIVFLERRNFWQKQSTSDCVGANGTHRSKINSSTRDRNGAKKLLRDAQTISKLWRDWWGFLQKNDLGGFANTIGSQSLRVFRHRWMNHAILIDNNAISLKLSRDAYRGGRCECYYIGKTAGDYYLVDANSFYAAIMCNMAVPVRLAWASEHVCELDLLRFKDSHVLVADVTVTCKEPVYGVREESTLLFPVGTFRVCLAGKEVVYAMEHFLIRQVHRAAAYGSAPAFKDYMIALWDFRQKAEASGNLADVEKWKMLMRSFYGKWAQCGRVWENVEHVDNDEIKCWVNVEMPEKAVTHFRQFGGIVQALSREPESSESMPAIAAVIAANARMQLWQYICEAKMENVLYVDTDSLLLNEKGYCNLRRYMDASILGGLRLVGRYQSAHIRAPKDYDLDHRHRRKALRRTAVQTGDATFTDTQHVGFSQLISGGDMSRAIDRSVVKHMSGEYLKGTVLADGKVVPFEKR